MKDGQHYHYTYYTYHTILTILTILSIVTILTIQGPLLFISVRVERRILFHLSYFGLNTV